MNGKIKEITDINREIYCRKLGHHLPMSYCLSPGQHLFCSSFRNCWFSGIDVDTVLSAGFSAEEIEEAERPSAPKITNIMSIIEKYRTD